MTAPKKQAKKHGGARPGAGRKPRQDGRHKRQIVLGDEAAAILDEQPPGERSAWVEGLILATAES